MRPVSILRLHEEKKQKQQIKKKLSEKSDRTNKKILGKKFSNFI